MRILVVEDEKRLAQALRAILEAEKYMVDTVYDGKDGYDYAVTGMYDAIVLDVMLPGIDGFEVVKNGQRRRKGAGSSCGESGKSFTGPYCLCLPSTAARPTH